VSTEPAAGHRAGFVCRLGGDEFCILLRGTMPDAADAMATRLTEAVARIGVAVGELQVFRKVSIGIAPLSRDMTLTRALIAADEALQVA